MASKKIIIKEEEFGSILVFFTSRLILLLPDKCRMGLPCPSKLGTLV